MPTAPSPSTAAAPQPPPARRRTRAPPPARRHDRAASSCARSDRANVASRPPVTVTATSSTSSPAVSGQAWAHAPKIAPAAPPRLSPNTPPARAAAVDARGIPRDPAAYGRHPRNHRRVDRVPRHAQRQHAAGHERRRGPARGVPLRSLPARRSTPGRRRPAWSGRRQGPRPEPAATRPPRTRDRARRSWPGRPGSAARAAQPPGRPRTQKPPQ